MLGGRRTAHPRAARGDRRIHNDHPCRGRARARYFAQVLFNEVQPESHFIGGKLASEGLIWIRADIRSGRTDGQKKAIMERIANDISATAKVGREDVWVYISDIPATGIFEFDQVLPPPGQEDAWFASLPDALRARLNTLS